MQALYISQLGPNMEGHVTINKKSKITVYYKPHKLYRRYEYQTISQLFHRRRSGLCRVVIRTENAAVIGCLFTRRQTDIVNKDMANVEEATLNIVNKDSILIEINCHPAVIGNNEIPPFLKGNHFP